MEVTCSALQMVKASTAKHGLYLAPIHVRYEYGLSPSLHRHHNLLPRDAPKEQLEGVEWVDVDGLDSPNQAGFDARHWERPKTGADGKVKMLGEAKEVQPDLRLLDPPSTTASATEGMAAATEQVPSWLREEVSNVEAAANDTRLVARCARVALDHVRLVNRSYSTMPVEAPEATEQGSARAEAQESMNHPEENKHIESLELDKDGAWNATREKRYDQRVSSFSDLL